MEKRWQIKPEGNIKYINHLTEVLGVDKHIANILVQRGVTNYEEAKLFFRPDLTHLYNPFLMKDMDKAVERFGYALEHKEKILVYGDYDVDGTTAVAMMYSFLKKIYSQIDYYIPDRYTEGYGISYKGIDYAAENGFTLIIALDCGIKAIEKVDYALKKNIDFIICDHHNAGDQLPKAVAVLDPKRKDCNYPFKELSGCGVGFKFIHAIISKPDFTSLHIDIPSELEEYLDLVCVSIASDIVPINGENRILAYFGLKKLNSNPLTGLRSIIKISGIEGKYININECVFKIGPRINAAGRIESGRRAVELLLSGDEKQAEEIGFEINNYNITRKDLDHKITQQALDIISSDPEQLKRKSTVLFRSDWHKGVLGIVASRLTETYYRPTIVLTESNGLATGSARSVIGFNLYDAIDSCSDLLESFGGHFYAAGLTLKLENVDAFIERFEKVVSNSITSEQLIQQIDVDDQIDLAEITPKFYRLLRQFEPYGPENMTPLFVTKNVIALNSSRKVGKTEEHIKLDLAHHSTVMPAIAFGHGHRFDGFKNGNPIDICYSIEENDFNGNVTLQLFIRDIKI